MTDSADRIARLRELAIAERVSGEHPTARFLEDTADALARLQQDIARETELRRVAETHNTELRAALDQKPYADEYDTLQATVDRLTADQEKSERVFQAVVYAFEGKDVPEDLKDHGFVKRAVKYRAATVDHLTAALRRYGQHQTGYVGGHKCELNKADGQGNVWGGEPHVCGLSGYNPMIDPPCPGCATRDVKRKAVCTCGLTAALTPADPEETK